MCSIEEIHGMPIIMSFSDLWLFFTIMSANECRQPTNVDVPLK